MLNKYDIAFRSINDLIQLLQGLDIYLYNRHGIPYQGYKNYHTLMKTAVYTENTTDIITAVNYAEEIIKELFRGESDEW